MPYRYTPDSLEASQWAHHRTSTSTSRSRRQSGGLLESRSRPQQQADTNNRQDRPRFRPRHPPTAPLGTREDVENEDYVSPLGMMFHRAYDRYRVAEEQRRQADQVDGRHAVGDENVIPNPLRSRRVNATDNVGSQQGFPEYFNYTIGVHQAVDHAPWNQYAHTDVDHRQTGLGSRDEAMTQDAPMFDSLRTADLRQQVQALQLSLADPYHIHHPIQRPAPLPASPALTIDNQLRPPRQTPEEMVVNVACTICHEHPINTVLLPCSHACMCKWCADLCIPTRRNTPYARAPTQFTGKCPKCRAFVKERREIFLG